jgi:hypothetical protein
MKLSIILLIKQMEKAAMMRIRKLNSNFQPVREGDFMISSGMGYEQAMNWLLSKI